MEKIMVEEPSRFYFDLMEKYPLEWKAYSEMNLKCYESEHPEYLNEGGKGIEVCERWRFDNPEGFINFLIDVGPIPDNPCECGGEIKEASLHLIKGGMYGGEG